MTEKLKRMRKLLLTSALAIFALFTYAQFTTEDIVYYVGDGPDTAYLVIDFLDGTEDSCYAWGYLFDDAVDVTGGDMLAAISDDEEMLNAVIAGVYLSDIYYNNHAGVMGEPGYWNTWSRTEATEWESNGGLPTLLENGDWFGCSYIEIGPAIAPADPLPAYESSKYKSDMIQFWIGEGPDSAVFVVDFVTSEFGEAMSYAWGYAFDGPTDGATMLNDISEADVNLSVNAEAFLNDILFNGLEGLAGDPYYWGTWSGTNLTDWTMNAGLGTVVNDGDWFGCSYAAWPPRRPFYPISAIDSAAFPIYDVEFIDGIGTNEVVVVIDFNEWLPGKSYVYGYHFDTETITAEEVLLGLQESGIYGLTFDLGGGFLNSIENELTVDLGIGGAPNYWSTWSASNTGGWELNSGIGEEMSDGDWFACSYTAWAPATPPSLPQNGVFTFGLNEGKISNLSIYPNPSRGAFQIVVEEDVNITLVNMQGKRLLFDQLKEGTHQMNLTTLVPGTYLLIVQNDDLYQSEVIIID